MYGSGIACTPRRWPPHPPIAAGSPSRSRHSRDDDRIPVTHGSTGCSGPTCWWSWPTCSFSWAPPRRLRRFLAVAASGAADGSVVARVAGAMTLVIADLLQRVPLWLAHYTQSPRRAPPFLSDARRPCRARVAGDGGARSAWAPVAAAASSSRASRSRPHLSLVDFARYTLTPVFALPALLVSALYASVARADRAHRCRRRHPVLRCVRRDRVRVDGESHYALGVGAVTTALP